MQILEIGPFLKESQNGVILDVRSPKEYGHAHIPCALSFPLFTDEERHKIGICYKQEGNEKAVVLGLEFVGPKLADFARKANAYKGKPIFIHCWRGGMRSKSMATLLESVGHRVYLLHGGYKSFRNHAIQQLQSPFKLINIAGYTGTAKTEILHILKANGHQMVDLEGLAGHKGSTFGNLDFVEQPSSEQFENDLFTAISKLDLHKAIYIEDESAMLGNVKMSDQFYAQLQKAPMLFVEKPRELRHKHLLNTYSKNQNIEAVKAAFKRISKRLGGLQLTESLQAVDENDADKAVDIALSYYDKNYYKKLNSRSYSRFIKIDGSKPNEEIADCIVKTTHKIYD